MASDQCQLPTPAPEALRLLEGVRTIAIIGLSPKPNRPSHRIGQYLQNHGYRIIPIRPATSELLGEKCFPSLLENTRAVDVVNIFRRSEAVPDIVAQAIQKGCKVIWMQEGVCHEAAAEKARQAGIAVVQNTCILKVLESKPS